MEKINVNNVCHQEFIELILKTHVRVPNCAEKLVLIFPAGYGHLTCMIKAGP